MSASGRDASRATVDRLKTPEDPPRGSAAGGGAYANSGQDRPHQSNPHQSNPHQSTNGKISAKISARISAAPTDCSSAKVYAALDLGTNNCRLLVARPVTQGFQVIDAFSRIIRLGEGLSGSGRLSEAAMARTIEALKVCTEKMVYREVQRARIIATEACRAAANGEEFIARVYDEAGLRMEIVSRETEARLAVSGCASLLAGGSEGALVFDIGGGSTEIIWLELEPGRRPDPLAVQQCMRAWTSLNIGVVTLAEKFGSVEITKDVFEAMVAEVLKPLKVFEAKHHLADLICGRNVHMLGTSGTVTTIAAVHMELPRYERSRVDGSWLSAEQVTRVTDNLVAMSYDERVANPCIGTERAGLVLAGCAILEAIRRQWPCSRLRVADRGLREGILCELMAEDGILLRPPGRRRRRRIRQARPHPAAGT